MRKNFAKLLIAAMMLGMASLPTVVYGGKIRVANQSRPGDGSLICYKTSRPGDGSLICSKATDHLVSRDSDLREILNK